MNRYIGFLRALNVGGHTIKMDRLRELVSALGFSDVATFIASGNIIFDAPEGDAGALEAQIEDHLRDALGYEVLTFLRAPVELAAVAVREPFDPEATEKAFALMVAFLKGTPAREQRERLMAYRSESDDFHIDGREVYWMRHSQFSVTKFGVLGLEKVLGLPATVRSITTVRKLAAKYPPA